jgi:hypothetical protein
MKTNLVQNDYKQCKAKLNEITKIAGKIIQVVVRE